MLNNAVTTCKAFNKQVTHLGKKYDLDEDFHIWASPLIPYNNLIGKIDSFERPLKALENTRNFTSGMFHCKQPRRHRKAWPPEKHVFLKHPNWGPQSAIKNTPSAWEGPVLLWDGPWKGPFMGTRDFYSPKKGLVFNWKGSLSAWEGFLSAWPLLVWVWDSERTVCPSKGALFLPRKALRRAEKDRCCPEMTLCHLERAPLWRWEGPVWPKKVLCCPRKVRCWLVRSLFWTTKALY